MMIETQRKSTIAICETQPVTAEGIRMLLSGCEELQFSMAVSTLAAALDAVLTHKPDMVILDKAFGVQAIFEWLASARDSRSPTACGS